MPRGRPHTLDEAITEYKASPKFRKRKPRTQQLYAGYLDQIRKRLGPTPIASIRSSMIEAVKIELQDHPSKANMWVVLLSLVLGHAKTMDWIPTNPASGIGKLAVRPRDEIWAVEDEARCMADFRPSLRLAFLLLLYTLQRPSDMLSMTTARISEKDGRLFIKLRQAKTDALIAVPVHSRLEPLVRERLAQRVTLRQRDETGKLADVETLLLVPSPRGKTWSRRNFSRAWDHDLRLANLRLARELFRDKWTKEAVRKELAARHRQRRDLRRTGVVRLAEAGATIAQIAAISGHSIDHCTRIIETYLPRRTEVAIGGIEAWERAEASPRVVQLAGKSRGGLS